MAKIEVEVVLSRLAFKSFNSATHEYDDEELVITFPVALQPDLMCIFGHADSVWRNEITTKFRYQRGDGIICNPHSPCYFVDPEKPTGKGIFRADFAADWDEGD